MTDTQRLWDRRADETPKSYAAFLAYVALGARRSVREAARQHCVKTASSGPKNTTVKHWLRWSARHKWVSRSLARDEWIARTSDDQIVSNVTACKLALTTRALDYLTANDGADFLRAARALSLHFPLIQRVADVSERIEDLSDIPDADIERMKEIRDAARAKNDIVGRLLEDHRKHCPDICGELEYPRTIPGKRQKANDVSESPAVRDSLLRTSPTSPSGPADPSVRPHGNTTATPQQPGKSPATRILKLKKIKLSWPSLHYAKAKGALLLSPSPPRIPPAQLRFVE